jgi:hypothetical protein
LARPRDGFLHACEIHGLPADLVVLSACSTALGAEVHGEGLMDLNTDTGNNALVFQVSHRPRALLRPWLEARLEQPHLHLGLQLARADLERAFRLEERAGAMREGAFIVAGFSDGAPPAQMAHLHLGLQLARADELLRKLWPFAAAAGPPCSSVPSLAAVSVASARAAAPCDTSVGALRGGRSFATGSDDAPMTRLWLAPEGSLHDTAPRDTSRHHALVVGINNYAAASGVAPLAYARRDAEREGDAFARLGYDTFRLIDGSATRENIINTLLREVLLSRSGDDFVFYYSGHGFADVHGRGALMTAAAGGQPVSVVPLSEIARILSFHRGTATVIIDSCLDGINVNLDGGGAHTNLVNGYGPNRARFISAGTPGSPALESERLQAGLYARALLDFLTHEAKRKHGSTGPYRLDFDGLFSATSVETARLARDLYGLEQHPARLTPSGNTVGR